MDYVYFDLLNSTISDLNIVKRKLLSVANLFSENGGNFQRSLDSDRCIMSLNPRSDTNCILKCENVDHILQSAQPIMCELINIKNDLFNVFNNTLAYFEGTKSMHSHIESLITHNLVLSESYKSEWDFTKQFTDAAYQFTDALYNKLFVKINDISIEGLAESIYDLISHYNELSITHVELSRDYECLSSMHQKCTDPQQQSSLNTVDSIMNRTAVFELLEREVAYSTEKLETARTDFDSDLQLARVNWESERSHLLQDLDESKELIRTLQSRLECNERTVVEYNKMKGFLDDLANMCTTKLVDQCATVPPLVIIRDFLAQLRKCCPWIYDIMNERRSSIVDIVVPNPIELVNEQKKLMADANSRCSALEDCLHRTQEQLIELKECNTNLLANLKDKGSEVEMMSAQMAKLEERVLRYRSYFHKLSDPEVAEAFIASLHRKQNGTYDDGDINLNNNESTTVTTDTSDVSVKRNSCIEAHQANSTNNICESVDATAVQLSTSTSTASDVNVTTIAGRRTFVPAKCLQSSTESLGDRKDEVEVTLSSSTPELAKENNNAQLSSKVEIPVTTKCSEFALPSVPVSMMSQLPARIAARRRPLSELPVTTGAIDKDVYMIVDKVIEQGIISQSRTVTTHEMHSAPLLHADLTFLSDRPLAESTAQLPSNLFQSNVRHDAMSRARTNYIPGAVIERQRNYCASANQPQVPISASVTVTEPMRCEANHDSAHCDSDRLKDTVNQRKVVDCTPHLDSNHSFSAVKKDDFVTGGSDRPLPRSNATSVKRLTSVPQECTPS